MEIKPIFAHGLDHKESRPIAQILFDNHQSQSLQTEEFEDDLFSLNSSIIRLEEFKEYEYKYEKFRQKIQFPNTANFLQKNGIYCIENRLIQLMEMLESAEQYVTKRNSIQIEILKKRYGYYGEEQTLASMGTELDVTRERIRQIEAKNINSLRSSPSTKKQIDLVAEEINNICFYNCIISVEDFENLLGVPTSQIKYLIKIVEKVLKKPITVSYNKSMFIISDQAYELISDQELTNTLGSYYEQGNVFKKSCDEIIEKYSLISISSLKEQLPNQFQNYQTNDIFSLLLSLGFNISEKLTYDPNNVLVLEAGIGGTSKQIAHAILEMSLCKNKIDIQKLSKGFRTDEIAIWLETNLNFQTTPRNIRSVCMRQENLFSRTGSDTWAYKYLVTDQFTEKAENYLGIIVKTIEDMAKNDSVEPFYVEEINPTTIHKQLKERWSPTTISNYLNELLDSGYISNFSEDGYNFRSNNNLPEELKVVGEIVPNNSENKSILTDLILETLSKYPEGLNESHLTSKIRDIEPEASSESISVYVNRVLSEFISKTHDGKFIIKKDINDVEESENNLTIIEAIVSVLALYKYPMTVEELTTKIQAFQYFKYSSIQGNCSNWNGIILSRSDEAKYDLIPLIKNLGEW